jgi:hypothetical protein|tara:strand:- start:7913 stop:9511 length:1599 start_codon:yes stop_codon:yes gene_type:complete
LRTNKLGAFYITKIERTSNGKKSEQCIINGTEINCELISRCQNGNCNELENYLINNKILQISKPINNQKTKNTNNNNKKVVSGNQLFINATTNKREIYVGEQIIVTYKLHTRLNNLENYEIPSEPNLNGFWKKDLSISSRFKQENINGITYLTAVIKKTVLTAQKSGKLTIDPMEVTCNTRVLNQQNRSRSWPNFGNVYSLKKEFISSRPIVINVSELPNPKPKGFKGAVGEFNISSNIDKIELKANDAITYSIKITGTGNIELIDAMKINFPEDFEVYDPKINDKIIEGGNKRSTKNYEFLLIPRYEGSYEIPSYTFIFFNPKTKKYITKKTSKYNISVLKSDNNEKGYVPITQQEIIESNKDINYIKIDTVLVKKSDKNQNLKLFYLLFFLPILVIIILRIILFFKKDVITNILDRKHKIANKIANKKLRKASECIKNKNFEGFFEETEKSLWGYFADKFKVQIADLSKESVESYFNDNNIKKDVEIRFIELINHCEFARYAPSNNKDKQMSDILSSAKKIIIDVESELK